MKKIIIGLSILFSSSSYAEESFRISCGASEGYSYYFESGLIDSTKAGFTNDAISSGQYTLTMNEDKEADILAKDATGVIKSARSEGGMVNVFSAGDLGMNWMALYPDGVIEIYSLNLASMKVVAYRNTVGNAVIAKNSLFVSSCTMG